MAPASGPQTEPEPCGTEENHPPVPAAPTSEPPPAWLLESEMGDLLLAVFHSM